MIKKAILAIVLCLFASVARAQGTPTAQWNTPDPLGMASLEVFTLKIDAAAPITLVSSCVTVNTTTQCTAPVPGYVPGNHVVVLTATNAFGSASATFNMGAPPSAPTGLTIVTTTTTSTTTTIVR